MGEAARAAAMTMDMNHALHAVVPDYLLAVVGGPVLPSVVTCSHLAVLRLVSACRLLGRGCGASCVVCDALPLSRSAVVVAAKSGLYA